MDFNLSKEQELLRGGLTKFLSTRYDLEKSRAAAKTGAGWQPEIWRGFADELGILGATFGEDVGGIGGGPVERVVTEHLEPRVLDGGCGAGELGRQDRLSCRLRVDRTGHEHPHREGERDDDGEAQQPLSREALQQESKGRHDAPRGPARAPSER